MSWTRAGREVPIRWRGRRTRAFVPMLLGERPLDLGPETTSVLARAQAVVEYAAEALPDDYVALARLLLRAEGVASSYIEGVTAPVVDVVLAEMRDDESGSPAGWVAANLVAAQQALTVADHELSLGRLCAWHRTLMAGSPTPARHVGVVRDEQGWIGGTSPFDAHLVTPPPDALPALLADLIDYVNRTDVDPIAQAAIAHAQFELIHPFADGNGRVGRILVAWVLVRRLALLTALPVSTRIAADVGGYGAGLVLFRMGDHEAWVRWFAEAVSGAGRAQQELVREVARLQDDWRRSLATRPDGGRKLRDDAAAWRVLDLLPGDLVLTGPIVSERLAIPLKSAHAALSDLVSAGILIEHGSVSAHGRGRPSRVFTSADLLGLAGSSPLR